MKLIGVVSYKLQQEYLLTIVDHNGRIKSIDHKRQIKRTDHDSQLFQKWFITVHIVVMVRDQYRQTQESR